MYCKLLGASLLVVYLVVSTAGAPQQGAQREDKNAEEQEKQGREEESSVSLHKRSLEEGSKEEMDILKDLILSHVVSEIQTLREKQQEEELQRQEGEEQPQKGKPEKVPSKKRFFLPLTGRREDVPTIKRQIRYHQCYFNPISCFRRK